MFGNPATAWVIVPILIFGIAGLKALLEPVNARIRAGERERLRKMYERLALEKLDVIRTALTMGYKQQDLDELDVRLEQVIGSEAMQKLLDGKNLPGQGKRGSSVIGINISSGGKLPQDKVINLADLAQGELGSRSGQRQQRTELNSPWRC